MHGVAYVTAIGWHWQLERRRAEEIRLRARVTAKKKAQNRRAKKLLRDIEFLFGKQVPTSTPPESAIAYFIRRAAHPSPSLPPPFTLDSVRV